MDELEQYGRKREEIMEENERLLELFTEDIQYLKPETIDRHVTNVEFYLDTYLPCMGVYGFKWGIWMLDDYLGNFFIRNCMWSTPGSVTSTAVSIKKFYQSMLKHEMVSKEEYEYLCETIERNVRKWKRDCLVHG